MCERSAHALQAAGFVDAGPPHFRRLSDWDRFHTQRGLYGGVIVGQPGAAQHAGVHRARAEGGPRGRSDGNSLRAIQTGPAPHAS